MGTFGEKDEYQTEYKIFVANKDYDKALYIINQ